MLWEGSRGPLPESEIPLYEITEMKFIGKGGFAQVYSGKYKGQQVAVKVLEGSPNENEIKQFNKEFELVYKLKSRYVVHCFGACMWPSSPLIVMELMERGSLKNFLSNNSFAARKALEIAREIAEGIQVLHKHYILHRDLKADNILMDKEFHCKISDFGLSILTKEHCPPKHYLYELHSPAMHLLHTTFKGRGTITHMAPETLTRPANFSERSDIYAFGMILWELISYKQPYDGALNMAIISRAVRSGVREPVDEFQNECKKLVEKCWSPDPWDRIPLCEIISRLDYIKVPHHLGLQTYIKNPIAPPLLPTSLTWH
jgi:serine/threonine protein kinase